MSARRYYRFKESLTGNIEFRGSSYRCVVEDISPRGLRLWSAAPVAVGERMGIELQLPHDARFSCFIEIRQITNDDLRAEIVEISDANAAALSGRIEEHCSAVRRAKAKAAGAIKA